MLNKIMINFKMICRLWQFHVLRCMSSKSSVSSLLYVVGDKRTSQVSVLSPYLDFDLKFANLQKLEKNVQARQLNLKVNKLFEMWEILKKEENNKVILEDRRKEITIQIKEFEDKGDKKKVDQFKHQGKLLREETKTFSKMLWELEEKTIINALKLPNDLHEDTPIGHEKCFYENESSRNISKESHLEIGQKLNLIDWRDNGSFFLLNNAALYEMHVMNLVSKILKKAQFIQVSNSDFVRSVVLEGCGISYDDPDSSFLIKNNDESVDLNRLHLVGSATLPAFCCLHSKQSVSKDNLPVRYMCLGRQYKPEISTKERGLYNAWQESAVGVFVGTPCLNSLMNEFRNLLDLVISFYKKLDYSFKLVYIPAHKLDIHESLKMSIQVYSPYLQTYIEVGKISVSGSFVSKRLLMCYQNDKDSDVHFLNVLSGVILSPTKLIGCAIENDFSRNQKVLEMVERDIT